MEVVEIRRRLKRVYSPGSEVALARALHDLFKYLTILCKWREALKAIQEAVRLDAGPYSWAYGQALYNLLKDNESSRDWCKAVFALVDGEVGENLDVYKSALEQAVDDAIAYYKSTADQWTRLNKWDAVWQHNLLCFVLSLNRNSAAQRSLLGPRTQKTPSKY